MKHWLVKREFCLLYYKNMKTHVIWFCVAIAALIVGTQFAEKEVHVL